MTMRSTPINPQQGYNLALDQLKAHRLFTEQELVERVQKQQRNEHGRFAATFLFELLMAAAFCVWVWQYQPSYTNDTKLIAGLICAGFVLACITVSTCVSYLKRRAHGKRAMFCLEHRDYENRDFVHYLGYWGGSYKLIKPQEWYWKSLSESVAPIPELSRIWATWLLSEAPIREADARILEEAIRLHKKAYEWTKYNPSVEDQLQSRAVALNHLPPEMIAQLKCEQLESSLSLPEGSGVIRSNRL